MLPPNAGSLEFMQKQQNEDAPAQHSTGGTGRMVWGG